MRNRTLVIFIVLFCIITHLSSQRLQKYHKSNVVKPLPDIGHMLFRYKLNEEYHHVVDIIMCLFGLYALFQINNKRTLKFMMIEILVVLFIRLISINLTIMPSSNVECRLGHSKIIANSQCNDMMFSGHTSLVFLTLLNLFYEGKIKKTTAGILMILYIATLLTTRSHYSVDIYIAIVISFLTDAYLRGRILNPKLRNRNYGIGTTE